MVLRSIRVFHEHEETPFHVVICFVSEIFDFVGWMFLCLLLDDVALETSERGDLMMV